MVLSAQVRFSEFGESLQKATLQGAKARQQKKARFSDF
jgi:hypothetical protein